MTLDIWLYTLFFDPVTAKNPHYFAKNEGICMKFCKYVYLPEWQLWRKFRNNLYLKNLAYNAIPPMLNFAKSFLGLSIGRPAKI